MSSAPSSATPSSKRGRLEISEALVSLCFAVYLFVGLPVVEPAFWAMVDGGLASGVRWVGQLMLLALVLEGAGVYFLTRGLPAPERRGVLRSITPFLVALTRWMVGLMVLVLGTLGLGIDVRPEPGVVALLLVLGLPTLKEALVYRRMFRNEPRQPQRAGDALTGKLLCLPLRLVLLTLIEGGLFVDLAVNTRADLGAAGFGAQLGMVVAFGCVIAMLYAILIFLPTRAAEIVHMHRKGRSWSWLPGFVLDVALIVLALLVG